MTRRAELPAVDEAAEILFEEGIIGVPRARRFLLLEREGSPIRMLRNLDIEGLVLPVVDPFLADPGYAPELGGRVTAGLGCAGGDPLLLLAITALERSGPVANLRAPLVIHVGRRRGAQVILDHPDYSLRAPVRIPREVPVAG